MRGKGGRPRVVKISHDGAQAVDYYLRARARHPQSWRPPAVVRRGWPRADDGERSRTKVRADPDLRSCPRA